MLVRRVTSAIGAGLIAGAAGTAAMTMSSSLEMRLRRRPPSMTPAKAAEKVLEVEPEDAAAEDRLATAVHWGYGTGWGLVRGGLGLIGIGGAMASTIHLTMVWGAALVMLPSLKVTPPPQRRGAAELAIDGWHHFVYAIASGLVYDALQRVARG